MSIANEFKAEIDRLDLGKNDSQKVWNVIKRFSDRITDEVWADKLETACKGEIGALWVYFHEHEDRIPVLFFADDSVAFVSDINQECCPVGVSVPNLLETVQILLIHRKYLLHRN